MKYLYTFDSHELENSARILMTSFLTHLNECTGRFVALPVVSVLMATAVLARC